MTAREMIYELKGALQKRDAKAYANLRIPELDFALNSACLTLVKFLALPRYAAEMGYEMNGRSIHDLRTLIRYHDATPINQSDGRISVLSLPSDYLFYTKCQAVINKGKCSKRKAVNYIQFDDDELDVNYKSDFVWGIVNIRLDNNGIVFIHEGDFIVSTANLTYLKRPAKIHNAQDYETGTYTDASGEVLVGSQNCDLPIHLHTEVVRLAALVLSGDMQMPDYQIKQANYNLSVQ